MNIIYWLRRPRCLKRSCFKLELNWRGLQKYASDRIGLGYDFSYPSIASAILLFLFLLLIMLKLRIMMLKLKLASENLDKGKSILGALPKLDKKEVKNPRAKKANS